MPEETPPESAERRDADRVLGGILRRFLESDEYVGFSGPEDAPGARHRLVLDGEVFLSREEAAVVEGVLPPPPEPAPPIVHRRVFSVRSGATSTACGLPVTILPWRGPKVTEPPNCPACLLVPPPPEPPVDLARALRDSLPPRAPR